MEHDAIKVVQRQFTEHLAALDDTTHPAERAIVYRNLSRHLKGWSKTLEEV